MAASVVLGTSLVLLLMAGAAVAAWQITGPRGMADQVRIGPIAVGGMSPEAAMEAVQAEVARLEETVVPVALDAEVPEPVVADGHVTEHAPVLAELGLDSGAEAAVARAWEIGRSGDPREDLDVRIGSFSDQTLLVELPVSVQAGPAEEVAEEIAADLSWEGRDADIALDPAGPTAAITESFEGGAVDAGALADQLSATATRAVDAWRQTWDSSGSEGSAQAAADAEIVAISVDAAPIEPEVPTAVAEQVAERAETLWSGTWEFLRPVTGEGGELPDEPVVTDQVPEGADVMATLLPSQIAGMLTVDLTGERQVTLDHDAVLEWAEQSAGGAPAEVWTQDTVDAEATAAVSWTAPPSREDPQTLDGIEASGELTRSSEKGWRFDPDALIALLEDPPPADQRVRDLPVDPIEPEVSDQDLAGLTAPQPLGSFTTFYNPGEARNVNIQRFAELVNGTIVGPGETLELNELVGERTAEKGFVPAGAISEGEFVDQVGGGVSQFATTFFNAAYFAGADLLEHQPHSYYISRYPVGREATINFPTVNLRIGNPSDQAFVIGTRSTEDSITVSIAGAPIAQVSGDISEPTNQVSGRLRDGFDVTVTRTRTFPDGTTDSDSFFHRYQPED